MKDIFFRVDGMGDNDKDDNVDLTGGATQDGPINDDQVDLC